MLFTPPNEILLFGGPIYTMASEDAQMPAEAILILGDRVVAVGDLNFVGPLASKICRRINLRGRAVFPGFEDSHIHLAQWCMRQSEVDLFTVTGLQEAKSYLCRYRDRMQKESPSENAVDWVLGGGWDKSVWGGFPTRQDLDEVFYDIPVVLGSKDGHSCWVNTAALRRAGITRETADPPGGAILRDGVGEPTGILQDNAAGLVYRAVPPRSPELVMRSLEQGIERLLEMGVVAVQVAEGKTTYEALQVMRELGRLKIRATMMVPVEGFDLVRQVGLRYRFGDEWLKVGPVKMFKDGSLGASTAFMFEPYEGSDSYCGLETMTYAQVSEAVRAATLAGYPVACHAIGDRACSDALDAIEEARSLVVPTGFGYEQAWNWPRHRIEHAQLLREDDIPRFGQLGVVASVQPGHVVADRYMADRQWGERARYAYPFRSLKKSGAVLAFGSDAPVEVPDPVLGIFAAVTRKRPSEPDSQPWYPEERVSVYDALRAYTYGAAYAVGDERLRGSLCPGKLADLVILSQDLMTCDEDDIMGTEVLAVMIGGKFVLAKDTL